MPHSQPHTFCKAERLCGKKRIDALFASGRSLLAHPIRAVYALQDGTRPFASILVSVPKRHFRHAVDRNRLKRLMREAYRLHKHLLPPCPEEGRQLAVAFLWVNGTKADYATVESRMKQLLLRIAGQLQSDPQPQTDPAPCPSDVQ